MIANFQSTVPVPRWASNSLEQALRDLPERQRRQLAPAFRKLDAWLRLAEIRAGDLEHRIADLLLTRAALTLELAIANESSST